jgi:predicted dithiol-disulfide oxidoreductase (DUF899 family)
MLFGHLKKEDTSIHVCKKMENLLEKMKKNNWKMLWVIVMLSLVFENFQFPTYTNKITIKIIVQTFTCRDSSFLTFSSSFSSFETDFSHFFTLTEICNGYNILKI